MSVILNSFHALGQPRQLRARPLPMGNIRSTSFGRILQQSNADNRQDQLSHVVSCKTLTIVSPNLGEDITSLYSYSTDFSVRFSQTFGKLPYSCNRLCGRVLVKASLLCLGPDILEANGQHGHLMLAMADRSKCNLH